MTKCQKDLVSNNHIQLPQQCTTPQWNVSSLSCSTCQSINKSHNYYFQSFFKCCHSGICVIVLQGTETPLTMPGEIAAPTRHWQEINISCSSNSQPRGVLNQTKTTKIRQKLLEATSWLELWQLKQALSNTPHPISDQRLLTPNPPWVSASLGLRWISHLTWGCRIILCWNKTLVCPDSLSVLSYLKLSITFCPDFPSWWMQFRCFNGRVFRY